MDRQRDRYHQRAGARTGYLTRVSPASIATAVRSSKRVNMFNQLLVLSGVIIGALASYLTTAANERARWKRTLDSRWDDRRVEAYALYAQAVKDIIRLSARIAAGRGISQHSEALSPTPENLDLIDSASSRRAVAWETVLLLGHQDTVKAAREWHESVWRLDWIACRKENANSKEYEKARSEVERARTSFYESARKDLQVKGGHLPDVEDWGTRLRRIRAD
jgi:hypothetical protein